MSIILEALIASDAGFLFEIARLCGLQNFDEQSVSVALKELGLLNPGESFLKYKELFGWKRGGAESYICAAEFDITTECQTVESRKYICKALFSFGPSSATIVSRWVERYDLLREKGLNVPRIYYAGDGIIIQDFIEHSLEFYLEERCGSADEVLKLYKQVMNIAMGIDDLQFCPIAFVHDLRVSATETCYLVDVGEDLGGPQQARIGTLEAQRQVIQYFGRRYPSLTFLGE